HTLFTMTLEEQELFVTAESKHASLYGCEPHFHGITCADVFIDYYACIRLFQHKIVRDEGGLTDQSELDGGTRSHHEMIRLIEVAVHRNCCALYTVRVRHQ